MVCGKRVGGKLDGWIWEGFKCVLLCREGALEDDGCVFGRFQGRRCRFIEVV